ncbi:protein similar isoform X3 [Anopheles maculipalpis]|uniref:protein similar isoform X3 n=1 Tax=Anopheles maculipalpis TaxID=1496333 RepID=UPI0021592E03|nr:protein similar isoform X3 [Anopheles maculipalpis]
MTKTAPKLAETNGTGKVVKPVKEKRRNNEKRKEKSRDAARCRRSRETEIFQDLASLLPMRPEEVEHLDKASVMRLSIAYLKARTMLELFPDILSGDTVKVKEDNDVSMDSTDEFNFNESKLSLKSLGLEPEAIALQTLDGFLMILSADGDVTYISENVSEYLGISQIDIMGQPIWDYSHQCDHDELREALNGRHHSPSELLNGVANSDCRPMENRDFFLRLKCTLTSRGRSVNIKSASYKVLHITGHIACKDKEGQRQLVAIARPLPHPANIEVPLGSSTFLTQHTLSMKFSYVDEMMLSLLGYQPSDLLGKSLYDCHHATDAEHLMATFKHVISKGQSETCRYRFLAKTGGYAWVVTQATVIYDKQKPHSVVCVNYVLSGVENKDDILSCAQLEARQQLSSDEPEQCNKISNKSVVCSSSDQLSIEQRPAAISLPSIGGADPEQVKVEETIPIPVQSSTAEASYVELIANNSAEQAKRNEPLAASGGKVLLCVKNDTPAAVSSEPVPNTRILRELNSIPAVPKPSAASGSRPVSVTASIFTSLPSGASGFGTEKSRAFNKPTVSGTPAQQSSATGSPQSVTAKLFVTLPPAVGGACTTSCNPGSNGGVSGSKPQHATEKIFAPRTEDMNKGFLMFSEEEPGLTMLKDEPDDLTHLAPTAGDACIPLEESGTFFNEMFEDFIIPDSYTLLQDELCSLDSQDTRLEASTIVSQSGTIGIPVSVSDSLTNGLNVTSVTSSPLGCTTSGTDGVPSLLIPNSGAGTNGSQALQNNRSPNTNASSSSPSSVSLSSSPVPSSPSRSHTSSNPNSPSGTSGLGSSASSTISTIDGRRHSTIGGSNHQHNATSNDPFINYRDEVNEVSPSPHLLSPGISKSPESSSLPSLCSPNGSLPEDELAFMSLNMDELDLSMRAPYISMSEVDDLPLLTSDDLLWGVPAATIEGNNSGTSISAFGLSGKFFIKDEFNTIGTSSNGPDNSTLGDQQDPSAVQHSLTVDKEHSLIMNGADTGSKNASITLNSSNGTIELSANNSNNDSKATLTTAAPASIDSSLAALLCGGTVISIQSEKSNVSQQSQPIGNQILTPHANSSLNAGNQQEHQRTNNQPQQHLHEQQFQLNSAQQRQEAPVNGKRIKLTEQNLHSMVVLPANVKLCDTWKFDDLLQLNGTVTTNAKGITQQGTVPQANIIASFVTTAAKKSAGSASVNGNNKRTLSGVSESTGDTGTGNNCKRLKSSATTTPSSAPQLLQQLMAPSPLPQKLKSKSRSSQDGTAGGRWPNGHAGANGGLLQEQSGNSVLMNLLVSGCDKTIPLTPPEVLIENATEFSSDGNEMQCDNGTGNMLYGLGDDDDGGGVLFSSTNPLIGGQRPLNDPIARPLTIQTDSILPGTIGNDGAVQGNAGSDRFRSGKLYATASATSSNQPTTIATPMDEFSMIVSPSLLTPTDMEIWRAIQQGQLDPKKITSVYGAGTTGSHIPKSLSSTPTAHLSAELLGGDGSEANLLATLDGDEFGGLGELAVSKDRTGSFRTIAANDGGALHHQGMLI